VSCVMVSCHVCALKPQAREPDPGTAGGAYSTFHTVREKVGLATITKRDEFVCETSQFITSVCET